MKLLLINVSKFWGERTYQEYPYGLGILATMAHEAGYDIRILDMAVDKTTVFEIVKQFKPDIIGLSFMSMSCVQALELVSSLKDYFKGFIISGGVHTSIDPIGMVKSGIDIAVIGEGELVFIKLLNYLATRKPTQSWDEEIAKIPNIAYMSNGEAVLNIQSKESVDLESLPIMNRSLFRLELYSHHSILTSRGCPYRCKFCCSWSPGGKSGRTLSSGRIIRELEYLISLAQPCELYWADEIFFWNNEERLSFCHELADKKLPITFTAQIRVDLIDDELVNALIKAGCTKLCFGAESGSDDILRVANKRTNVKQLENAINICREAGLRTKTWWMVGLPGGDSSHQLAALDIIARSKPNEVAVHQFVPLPGSDFWNNADRYGINLPQSEEFEQLTYYTDIKREWFNYTSTKEINNILFEYERRLRSLGYVATDEAEEWSEYIFTTPSQHKTFTVCS